MHILYSCSSYRLFRGLHLSVSPVCILGLVSCVYCPFIAQIMIATLHNRAPQAGTDATACMTAHLHRIHTCYAPRCCPHSQACSLSSLSAVIIHLKPPPLVHTAHLPPSLPPSTTLHPPEREATWIAFLWEFPPPSHQLPGSSGSGEVSVGKSKETTTRCQPCPHYSERNCSKAGVGEQQFIWIVKMRLP